MSLLVVSHAVYTNTRSCVARRGALRDYQAAFRAVDVHGTGGLLTQGLEAKHQCSKLNVPEHRAPCRAGGLDVTQLELLLKELGHPMEKGAVQAVFNEYDLDRYIHSRSAKQRRSQTVMTFYKDVVGFHRP